MDKLVFVNYQFSSFLVQCLFMKKFSFIWLGTLLALFFLMGCSTETAVSPTPLSTTSTQGLATAASTRLLIPTSQALPPTITAVSTATITATPQATTSPTATPSPTPIGPCTNRQPAGNLLTIVTQTYGLSRDSAPPDLVLLTDYLPIEVTLGYPSELRQVALAPLQQMIAEMQTEGLQPRILSGYRSYAAQAISWEKWNREVPEYAAILSARPGHSEHQLGTTVDFGSPELAEITGIADIQFHTYFYQTSEGRWLAENGHLYGFTLSYPRGALETTGFYYEPWHFRYVGVETATFLYDSDFYLTEYQLSTQPEPCIP
ncbi:D-alanyl-D-alanine carboxypeptidase [hydrothermal vent metagenome]|uniref:D-alanyl-D-alanine carboxypeptidase n=1 Tax=hydrothermal vent metagenome TaxID=652676 RepID=A0A3B0VHM0_9ZZZZ